MLDEGHLCTASLPYKLIDFLLVLLTGESMNEITNFQDFPRNILLGIHQWY